MVSGTPWLLLIHVTTASSADRSRWGLSEGDRFLTGSGSLGAQSWRGPALHTLTLWAVRDWLERVCLLALEGSLWSVTAASAPASVQH